MTYLFALPGMIILDSFVFMSLWNWYIPTVFGFQSLTIVQAFGISLVVSFVTHQVHLVSHQVKKENKYALITTLLKPFVYLAFGFIGTLFLS